MNPVVRERIDKAEADFLPAGRELRAQPANYDAVCFHAQRCAEKLIKGLLIELGVTPPKLHDLVALDRLLAPACSSWSWSLNELRLLSRGAVIARYPGPRAQEPEAVAAMDICTRMRTQLLALLNQPT